MAPKVRYGSYGKYSGPYIKGTEDAMVMPIMEDDHWQRVLWLTIMVESGGKLGSVMMADGTACTAGIEQSILVYPRNLKVQGPLPGLLHLLDHFVPISYYTLGQMLEEEGWMIGGDKTIREFDNGQLVSPHVLRDTLTPYGGIVPRKGTAWQRARAWALAFHELFSMKETREAQIKHAIDGFTKFARRVKHKKLEHETIEDVVYNGDCLAQAFEIDTIEGAACDLAMAMLWNYKTNAPAPALTRLGRVTKRFESNDPDFARFLLRQLGTSSYGRWATNRWRRSRQHAMKVWPDELFKGPKAVMPKSFV
jgi:hypothetical protein